MRVENKWKTIISNVADSVGSSERYVADSVVPEWFLKEPSTESEYYLAAKQLAGYLGTSVERLENSSGVEAIPDFGLAKCKGVPADNAEKFRAARITAQILARQLVRVSSELEIPRVKSAADLREEILGEAEIIDLNALVNLCWRNGIPVAHLANPPKNSPYAMAFNIEGRKAIVTIRNESHSGLVMFYVAHELGHIMLGHVEPGEATDGGFQQNRQEEEDANNFALELLTGSSAGFGMKSMVPASELLTIALNAQSTFRVDAQWIIASVGHDWHEKGKNYWGTVRAALKLGWPSDDSRFCIDRKLKESIYSLEATYSEQLILEQLSFRK